MESELRCDKVYTRRRFLMPLLGDELLGKQWLNIETGVRKWLLEQRVATSFEAVSKATQSIKLVGRQPWVRLFIFRAGARD
jgi:hypothetical protein